MSPEMQKLLWKCQSQAVRQLKDVVAIDVDAASFFKQFEDGGEIGFRDGGACTGNLLVLPTGPKEATGSAHLHIEERYSPSAPHDLVRYRYEICWQFERIIPASREDYLRDSLITLRRGVRFDHHPGPQDAHHPGVQDAHHPKYHWHPNGCSEFRLASGQMTPLKTALIAVLMFDRERVKTLTDARFTKALEDLRREIPGLPDGAES